MTSKSKVVRVGNVLIGGENAISVQSMTKTDTRDSSSTIDEILRLEDAGCEIIRVAVPDMEASESLKNIKKAVHIPVVADIHFDPRLAIESIKNGVDKIRLNPSNIKDKEWIKAIASLGKERHVAIRVGANLGSFNNRPDNIEQALVDSAIDEVRLLEEVDFEDIVVSIKTSDVLMTVLANEHLSKLTNYPIHLGITEAGPLEDSLIKSSVGIGKLLLEGIGDTIRFSITGDPVFEVRAGFTLLKSLGLRRKGLEVISCPVCGRTEIDVLGMVNRVKETFQNVKRPMKVAVMGCVVNGPGEAADADVGIAGGKNSGVIFRKGKIVRVVHGQNLLGALMEEINNFLEKNNDN